MTQPPHPHPDPDSAHHERLTAVQLTARGAGAIGVILVAGTGATDVLKSVARAARVARLQPGEFALSALAAKSVGDGRGEPLDEAIVVRTGPERYELHVHGGIAIMAAVLAALEQAGATVVGAEEAQRRGLLGIEIDGELQLALPLAVTDTALRLLLNQPWALTRWAEKWRIWLGQAGRGAQELWRLQSAAQWLLERSRALARLLDRPRIAIIGPPNAGKSTLANALLGRPSSITSEQAGTTRDWVDAQAIFCATLPRDSERKMPAPQVAVTLVDTAGLRETSDPIERESIDRAHRQAGLADVIVAVFDAARPPTPAELAVLGRFEDRPLVVALNKMDALHETIPAALAEIPAAVQISARTSEGLPALMTDVLGRLDLHTAAAEEPFAFNARQVDVLKRLCLARELRKAPALLDEFVNGGMAADS